IDARIVTALSLSFESWGSLTKVFIGDPPAGPPELYEFRTDVEVVAQRTHYSRVAAFIGDAELAIHLSGTEDIPASPRSRVVTRTLGNVTYAGSRLTLDGETSQIRIFVGLEAGIREGLLGDSIRGPLRKRAEPSGVKMLDDTAALEPESPRDHDPTAS